jgi:hypothetical protein
LCDSTLIDPDLQGLGGSHAASGLIFGQPIIKSRSHLQKPAHGEQLSDRIGQAWLVAKSPPAQPLLEPARAAGLPPGEKAVAFKLGGLRQPCSEPHRMQRAAGFFRVMRP